MPAQARPTSALLGARSSSVAGIRPAPRRGTARGHRGGVRPGSSGPGRPAQDCGDQQRGQHQQGGRTAPHPGNRWLPASRATWSATRRNLAERLDWLGRYRRRQSAATHRDDDRHGADQQRGVADAAPGDAHVGRSMVGCSRSACRRIAAAEAARRAGRYDGQDGGGNGELGPGSASLRTASRGLRWKRAAGAREQPGGARATRALWRIRVIDVQLPTVPENSPELQAGRYSFSIMARARRSRYAEVLLRSTWTGNDVELARVVRPKPLRCCTGGAAEVVRPPDHRSAQLDPVEAEVPAPAVRGRHAGPARTAVQRPSTT